MSLTIVNHQGDVVLLGDLDVLLKGIGLCCKLGSALGSKKVQTGLTDCSNSRLTSELGNTRDCLIELRTSFIKWRFIWVQRNRG
jgi:hypothetical protein